MRSLFSFHHAGPIGLALLIAVFAGNAGVVVINEPSAFVLDNGVLRAQVSKDSGDLTSLRFRGMEVLHVEKGRPGGYWSHNTSLARAESEVTIDPGRNGGERGEVAIRGRYAGIPLGNGPGGSAAVDIEIRYCLAGEDSALYVYSALSHSTNHPATSIGEARFCAKLNDSLFDWMTVDSRRNLRMITAFDWNHGIVMNVKEARRMTTGDRAGSVEHKYDYSANQFETRAWGWSSSKSNVGAWFINPSVEYLSGGPTKFELCAHRDATFGTNRSAPAPPTLLNYWRSSHYGGSTCALTNAETWTKVIGPFLIYCNTGNSLEDLWRNALQRAGSESNAWPYAWVKGVDYAKRQERGGVEGRLVLSDPYVSGFNRLLVGLVSPEGGFSSPRPGSGGADDASHWQSDAKHCQFWTVASPDGQFRLGKARPGSYTLCAIADGVLGQFTLTNVTVSPGKTTRLGELRWTPKRYGKQVWEIGIPNRTAAEFFKGDDYFHWGWYLEYPKLFPNDVQFRVGRSDFRKDWFFEQVPHNENPANLDGKGSGRSTTWSVLFNMPIIPKGRASLRLAVCGAGTRSLAVSVNSHSVGNVTGLVPDSTVIRDGIGGRWSEHSIGFDARLLLEGENQIDLSIPAGSLANGILYDYLRLEIADE
jgi:rhamnogalacturonan endolyase